MAVPKQLHAHIAPTALLQAQVDILKSENSPPRGWVVAPWPSAFLACIALSFTHNEAKGGRGMSLLNKLFCFVLQELKANRNTTMKQIEV